MALAMLAANEPDEKIIQYSKITREELRELKETNRSKKF